ncbi:MAG: zinc dependent phospholipase C family protein [Saprospiraceae bacterium]
MAKKIVVTFILAFAIIGLMNFKVSDIWGFYVHRLINQKAIYLLPIDLIPTFKLNLEELRHFAIAPDQRRYSSRHEAARHYIDLDHLGAPPFSNVSRKYNDAVWHFSDVYFTSDFSHDTLFIKENLTLLNKGLKDSLLILFHKSIRYSDNSLDVSLTEEEIDEHIDLSKFSTLKNFTNLHFINHLDEFGILPYHLLEYQNRLKWAFLSKNIPNIIRIAGEMGHYIGDAHVPLHTTENYNGQLTGQDGIHAFWETRIPELFAISDYDFWVEPAEYIENKSDYFWNIVLKSHDYVDDVLTLEIELRDKFPKDNQYCFNERLGVTKRTECKAYAEAYQTALNGMVEERMRDAITAIGSSWYTAWVDAGSPTLTPTKIVFQEEPAPNPLDSTNLRPRIHNR